MSEPRVIDLDALIVRANGHEAQAAQYEIEAARARGHAAGIREALEWFLAEDRRLSAAPDAAPPSGVEGEG